MRIILDPAEAARAFATFLRQLGRGTRAVRGELRRPGLRGVGLRGGTGRAVEVRWNPALNFWFVHQDAGGRHKITLGLDDPASSPRLEASAEIGFRLSGADRRQSGAFVRFGQDVLVAHSGRLPLTPDPEMGPEPEGFLGFLRMHGYPLTSMPLGHWGAAGKGGGRTGAHQAEALLLASVSSPQLAANIRGFASAARDYAQWRGLGLLPGDTPRLDFSPEAIDRAEPCPLRREVLRGLRDGLERYIVTRGLGLRLGFTPQGDLVLAHADGAVAGVVHAATDLSPASLQTGVGRLLVTRLAPRAAKFLAIPGVLGPFFTQSLFRHGVHAVSYKPGQDMAVVLDAEAVLDVVQSKE